MQSRVQGRTVCPLTKEYAGWLSRLTKFPEPSEAHTVRQHAPQKATPHWYVGIIENHVEKNIEN